MSGREVIGYRPAGCGRRVLGALAAGALLLMLGTAAMSAAGFAYGAEGQETDKHFKIPEKNILTVELSSQPEEKETSYRSKGSGRLLVALHSGCGKEDGGFFHAGIYERDFNLELGRRLQLELIDRRQKAMMTR